MKKPTYDEACALQDKIADALTTGGIDPENWLEVSAVAWLGVSYMAKLGEPEQNMLAMVKKVYAAHRKTGH